jgi:serine protease Do
MLIRCLARARAWALTLAAAGGLVVSHVTAASAGVLTPTALAPPASFASVVDSVKGAVVSIRLPGLAEDIEAAPLGDLLPDLLATGGGAIVGAGVILDASGTTLTSASATEGSAGLEVVMLDGTVVKAEIVGVDERTDLALLRLDPARRPFPFARLADSDAVAVGDWVIAIGAPYGLEATVTAGIISAPAGTEFLQSDVALSAGSAGGPLVNTKGQVLGIVTSLGGDNGIGFAVPSNTVRQVAASLNEWGRVRRAWLGATTQSMTSELARGFRRPDARGVLVADVEPGGPAAAAGLRPGDILLDLDAMPLRGRQELNRALARAAPAQTVRLTLWRNGRTAIAAVVLGEEPGPPRRTPGLGLAVRPLGPGLGVIVTDIDPGGPAAAAGVQRGDVIREIDRQPVGSTKDYERIIKARRKDNPLVVRLQRGVTAHYVALTPGR